MVSKHSLELRFTFDLAMLHRIVRVDRDEDGKVTRAEADAAAPDIASFLEETVTLEVNGQKTELGTLQPLGWPVDAADSVEEKNYGQTLLHFTFSASSPKMIADFYVLYELFTQLGAVHRAVANIEQEGKHMEVVFTQFEPDYVYDTFWQEGERPLRFTDGVQDVWDQWWLPCIMFLFSLFTLRWSLLKWTACLVCMGLAFWVFGNMWADPLLRAGPWKAGVIAGMMLVAIMTLPLRTLARDWQSRSAMFRNQRRAGRSETSCAPRHPVSLASPICPPMSTSKLPSVLPSELGKPIYVGSVQHLYAVPGREDLMVCETTNAGSVFDVGSIFDIPGSDVSRATFRHALYTRMSKPETWAKVRDAIVADPQLPASFKEDIQKGPLETMLREGARTHHIGMLDAESGEICTTGTPKHPSVFNVVRRFPVMKPVQKTFLGTYVYDYAMFHQAGTYVIPLECIVRFGITGGSSVLKKYGTLTDSGKRAYESELGLTKPMEAWQFLEKPIFDLTSKHEPEDRNVSKQEALLMSGLEAEAFVSVIKMTILGAWAVRQLLDEIGLLLWDIKWEFAVDNGDFFYVDTIDTDSFRATSFLEVDGKKLVLYYNKQAMRDYYKIVHADWFTGVNDAKKEANKSGTPFKEVLKAGQAAGKWPNTPVVDAEFLALQAKKMDLIRRHVLAEADAAQVKAGLKEVGVAEVGFYQKRGLFAEYAKANAVG